MLAIICIYDVMIDHATESVEYCHNIEHSTILYIETIESYRDISKLKFHKYSVYIVFHNVVYIQEYIIN